MSQISPLKHANEQYIFVPDPNSVAESQEKQSDFHQTQGRNNEPTDIYLHGLDLAILVVIFMMGSFAISLDATIITTAIPRITAEFQSLNDVGWYGSAYLVTTMATQPTWSRIYQYFEIKWTFTLAIVLFEAGSIICAAAPNSPVLILGRAVAGVGAASLFSGAVIVMTYRIPIQKRTIYFALVDSMQGMASVVGPPLSGVFTDSAKLTWRFCFWINLPLGGLLVFAVLVYFKSLPRPECSLSLRQKLAKLDLSGAILLLVSLACLFIALENGGSQYDWSDKRAWGWLIGFVLAFVLFICLQAWLGAEAAISPRIVRQRTIISGCLYTFMINLGCKTHAYFLPFYFQSAKGVSAQQSGLYLVPYLASTLLSSIVSSGSSVVTGLLWPFALLGATLFAVGCGLLTTLKVDSVTGYWIGLQILAGAGFGSSVQFALVAMQATLPLDDAPVVNGLFFLSNFGGGALGVGLAQAIFINILNRQLAEKVPQVDSHTVTEAGATAIMDVVPAAFVSAVMSAYDAAITRAFLLPTAAAVIATVSVLGIKWVNVKKRI